MARGARGRGRGARGGRGRGGRGRGLGEPSGAQEVTQDQSVESQAPLGPESLGANVGSGVQAPSGVAGAVGAQGQEVADLLRLLLERLTAPVQAQVGRPEVAGVQPGAEVVQPVVAGGQPGGAEVQPVVVGTEELPSYLRMMEQMQRIGTGFFSGGAKPEEADMWRCRLERNFQSLRCPEGYRVDLAVHYLEGDAHLWWRGVASRRSQASMSWADFLAEFSAKYFPQEAVDRMESQFLQLTQGERSVREYDEVFGRLLVHAGRGFGSEEAQIRRFLHGLRPVLRTRCRPSRFATRAELVETAAAIEEDLRAEQAAVVSPPVQQQQRRSQPQQAGANRGGRPVQGQKRKWEGSSGSGQRGQRGPGGADCFGCGGTGHRVADCPKRRELRATGACFLCGEVGHIRARCPRLQPTVAAVQPVQERAVDVQPLRQLTAPRVFTSVETGGSSARPITGTSLF